ncbi:MAG: hypothetical protein IH598_16230 [Bacteroidales bacterium]|nr:hypothetical protein [Bacteroidales bacterium]
MNIVTEFTGWFIILCILSGLLYAGVLYYKNRKEDFNPLVTKSLAVFRFIAITMISFLLLNPMLKSLFRNYEKPLVILAQDNSESLLINSDSVFYTGDYQDRIADLVSRLEQDYTVRTYQFGDKVSEGLDFSWNSKQTDISAMFDEIVTRYSNRNVGAMLIATDGLYNKGINPVYSSERIKFPVYTLALGDTSVRKDLFLRRVNFNRIAFLGNTFPIEVVVGANMCEGQSSILTVSSGGTTLFSQNVTFTSGRYTETIQVQINADKAGLQRYRISLRPLDGEISTANNAQDIFIDVLDTKQKILILSAAPHPDIAALKEAIESNFTNEVTHSVFSQFAGNIAEYNLLILHQLPGGNQNISRIITEAGQEEIPILFIVGTQSNLAQFNALNTGIQIFSDKEIYNESLPALNNEFSLFTVSELNRKAFEGFPPLVAPFGEIKTQLSATALFYQQIGSLVTGYPLVMFNQTITSKTGVIAGEGIWRWRITDFQKNGNHNAFNELFSKMVQYLSVKADRNQFRITCENNFLENEPVLFDAEVYNQSYELINDPEVEIVIKGSSGSNYPFTFSKTANAYQLNAGVLPVDNYTYEAKVRVGEKLLSYRGEFTVSPLNIEALNTIADHNMLFRLATRHTGQMIYPDQMEQFPEILKARDDIRTIVYTEKRFSELTNIFWVLLIILSLLSAEWLIRKRSGSY